MGARQEQLHMYSSRSPLLSSRGAAATRRSSKEIAAVVSLPRNDIDSRLAPFAQTITPEIVGSKAFNIENENRYTDIQIRKDLISYLCEYRLQVQTYDYELLFSYKEGEGYKLRDVDRGEAVIANAQRAIQERIARGESTHREEEEFTGIHHLDDILHFAKDGDGLYWFSPPGPKKDGYGDYGFFYEGHVTQIFDEQEKPAKHLATTAIRLEKPTIAQCNTALSKIIGKTVSFANAEGFLASPEVGTANANVDEVLADTFSFTVDMEERAINNRIVAEMGQMIDDYIIVVRNGTREDKIRGLHALENYALERKKRYKASQEVVMPREVEVYSWGKIATSPAAPRNDNYEVKLVDIMINYDFKPPTAAGSCGSTSEDKAQSNDIFANNYNNLMKAIFGDLFEELGLGDNEEEYSFNTYADCVVCEKKTMVGPCDICEPCDKNIRAKSAKSA